MLLQIVPYMLAAAVSPFLLIVVIMVLAQPVKPKLQAFVMALGALTSAIAIGTVLFFVIHFGLSHAKPSASADIFHIIIGLSLFWLAWHAYHKGPAKKPKDKAGRSFWGDYALGVALMATNITTLIMFVPAATDLQNSPGVERLAGLCMMIFGAMLPILIPLLILVVLGKAGDSILDKLGTFMHRYGHLVTAIFIAVIGLYVLLKGLIPLI
jgi:hypothetical protein